MTCYDSYVRTLKRKNVRGGFTLVELLIVIVVIGILSAMMMISVTEVMASAKANNIIVSLQQWKKATLEWYADNIDKINEQDGRVRKEYASYTDGAGYSNFAENVKTSDIAKYINGSFKTEGVNRGYAYGGEAVQDSSGLVYWVDHKDTGKGLIWLIGCRIPDDARIQKKLEGRAKSIGLWYMPGGLHIYTAAGEGVLANGKGRNAHLIWVKVIDFSQK